jgi:hypothetical protein
MSELHHLWLEQCRAARTIAANWGVRQALEYLIAEKFLAFVREARRHDSFATELPRFAEEVKASFERDDLAAFLADLEDTPPRRADDDPIWAAEEILAIAKAREILL